MSGSSGENACPLRLCKVVLGFGTFIPLALFDDPSRHIAFDIVTAIKAGPWTGSVFNVGNR